MTTNYLGVSPPTPLDSITIMQAAGKVLAKKIDRRRPLEEMFCDYDNPYLVDLTSVPINRLDDIGDLLSYRLLHDYSRCAVYGAIVDPNFVKGVRRLSRMKDGHPASLQATAHLWAAYDVDDVARPDEITPDNLHECARLAIACLPPAFHGVRCITQATGGHGLKHGCRLRLWFWFSRPLTGKEQKIWLKGSPIDKSTLSAAQPIYTAQPVFVDGGRDHLPWRLAWVNHDGPPHVEVPAPELLQPPPKPPAPPRPCRVAAATESDTEAFVKDSLARVAAATDGQRHRTRFNEARLLGGIAEEAGLDDETLVQWIIDANPPQDRFFEEEKTIREGIEAGRQEPIPILPRSLLTALPDSDGSKAAASPQGPQQPRSRSSETVRLMLKLLSARTKSPEDMLVEVFAENAKRAQPLIRCRMEECIKFAIARHRDNFHV